MEKLLFLGVPILKHSRVLTSSFKISRCYNIKNTEIYLLQKILTQVEMDHEEYRSGWGGGGIYLLQKSNIPLTKILTQVEMDHEGTDWGWVVGEREGGIKKWFQQTVKYKS